MKNDSLIQHLETIHYPEAKMDALRQAGITTQSRLLTLIADDTTEPTLRAELCDVLGSLHRIVDKRRIAAPLLAALDSNNLEVVWTAARAITTLGLKRAIPMLSKLAIDKQRPDEIRMDAIQALGSMHDARTLAVLRTIAVDKNDDPDIRGTALEETCFSGEKSLIKDYITLLSDDSPDVRFWAAYCLGQLRYENEILPALEPLDYLVAFDHSVPVYFGWHLDREALLPFERIYFHSLIRDTEDVSCFTWLISPTAEYLTFMHQYRHATDGVYRTETPPPVSLQIDPAWLTARLQEYWTTLALNVRRPAPKAYLVDFQLVFNGQMLIGGLHRDGYALVLTGDQEAVFEFTAWYRGLFGPDQPLFLYEWANFGTNLTPDISAQGIRRRASGMYRPRDESGP